MGVLSEILAQKAREVSALREAPSASRPESWPVRDVLAALTRPQGAPLRLIAEIKYRSPSAGPLSRALGPGERARRYQEGGASMISVLTDTTWFGGSFDDLGAARSSVSVPVLCKDFIIDPIQIERAWAAGADSSLIIVRCLPRGQAVAELVAAGRTRGLEPFVEVVDEQELELAIDAGARVIGVNARDLDTLEMNAERARRVVAQIPRHLVAVHLSGLKSGADASEMAASWADAALVGEALMRRDDPEALVAELARGASIGKN